MLSTISATLCLKAPAKVNLSLRVCGRRADGYHELESLVAFASIGDTLRVRRADTTMLDIVPAGAVRGRHDNLVMQAHAALQAHSGRKLPVHVELEKKLPIAAGLGGGSADAAACLRALNQLFDLQMPPSELLSLGARLGADVPVCLASSAHYMTGIGETLTPVKLPAADIVLVHPRIPLATGDVFAGLQAGDTTSENAPCEFQTLDWLADYVRPIGNDLTTPATKLVPEIAACLEVLQNLPDVVYAAMSGSGAACFALFPVGQGADGCAAYRRQNPQDWSQAGHLISAGDTKIDQSKQ